MNKKKIFSFFMAMLMILSSFGGFALPIQEVQAATSVPLGEIHLAKTASGSNAFLFNGSPFRPATLIVTSYTKNGVKMPAYCIEPSKPGATTTAGYNVTANSLYDNPKVVTAIMNGFPFVDNATLGVDNDVDAYAVTKLAVWAVLKPSQFGFNTTRYKANGASNQNVVDALERLVNKANAATSMPSTGQSLTMESTSKIITPDGNTQTEIFQVKSGGANFTGTYTAKLPTSVPAGTTLTQNGDKFTVVIPLADVTPGTSGSFDVKLEATGSSGGALVYSGIPNSSAYQSYAVAYESEVSGSGTVEYTKDAETTTTPPPPPPPSSVPAGLRILKRKAGTTTGLAGAKFRLVKLDDPKAGIVGDYETNTAGEITFPELTPGAYKVMEIAPPKGYLLDTINVKNVTITAADQTMQDVAFENFEAPKLKLYKTDSFGKAIEGAMFKIALDGGTESYIGTTDAKGEILFGTGVELQPGTYSVTEISVPLPYILDKTPKTVKLVPGKDTEVAFTNAKKVEWRLWKYIKGTSELIDGAQFSIKNLDTNTLVWEGVVEGGMHSLDNLDPGWYRITEIATAHGYVMEWVDEFGTVHKDAPYKDIKLEADKEVDIKFDNIPRAELEINKIDNFGKPVAGAVFKFKKGDGATQFEKTTDENGKIVIAYDDKDLILSEGVYEVTETLAPAGYIMDKECVQTVTLENGTRKILTFVNRKKSKLTLLKIDELTKLPLEGAKFKIIQTENKTIKEAITDKDGKIVLTDLDDVIYSIEEIVAPTGYILEPQHKDVKLKAGEDMELVFTNKPKGKIRIQKVDGKTGELLKNAEFTVTKVEDKTVSNYILETGEITLHNLDEGIYEAHEFMAPDGYDIVKDKLQISVEWGKTKTLKFDNIRKAVVIFQKTNALTNKGIPGTKFKVEYEMPVGGVKNLGSFTTDSNGRIIIPKAEAGWYIFTETLPSPGFSLPKNPVTRMYFASGDNAYLTEFDKYYTAGTGVNASGSAPNDGITKPLAPPLAPITEPTQKPLAPPLAPIESTALGVHYGGEYYTEGEGFNWPLNSIVLKKADANTGKLLSGAAIELYRADEQVSGQPGTQIGRYVTDASGVVVVVGLEPGYYVAKEVQPPPNYELAETSLQNGFLKADGTTVLEFTFRNYPYGNILVTKVDGITGEPLANATFTVTNNAGAAVGNSTGEFTTDSKGEFLVPNVPPGSYVVSEKKAPANYAINTTPKTIQVGTDGKTYKASFDNYPYGAILISKVDGNTGIPLANAKFKVVDNAGKVVGNTTGEYITDSKGEILIPNVAPGNYVATEISPPENYAINTTPITIQVGKDGKTYKMSFDNYPYGAILISKVDGITGVPLANAKFKVTDNAGKVVGNTTGEYITDSKGEILIPNVAPGNYVATEISPPENYAINTTPKTIQIGKDGKTYKMSFDNFPYGTLVLKKLDTDTKEPLEGAVFKVTTSSGDVVGNSNGEFTTDIKGTITIPNIPKGSYIIEEIKEPTGYILENQTKTVVVDYGKSYTLEFFNKKKSSMQIVKIDGVTKQPLKDAEFKVYKMDGELLGVYKTDEDGLILFDKLPSGWYKIVESKAPTGYIIDDTPRDIEIKGNQFVKVVFENMPMSSLVIKKYDSLTKQPLMGAKFKITKKSGEVIDEYSSDANGLIQIDHLEPGWYTATEISPPVGYKIYDGTKDFQITNTKTVTLEFPNDKLTSLVIKKVDDKSGAPLIGAKFVVEKQNGEHVGEYTTDKDGTINIPTLKPDFYIVREKFAPDGYLLDESPKTVEVKINVPTIITFTNKKLTALQIIKVDEKSGVQLGGAKFIVENQKGELIGTYTTDAQGYINIPELAPNFYVVKEKQAPDGYLLDESPKTVEVKTNTPTVITFTNKKLTSLQIKKIDEASGKALPGAVFEIERQNGEKVTTGENGTEFTTDAQGFINIPTLKPDHYIVREIKQPIGYILDKTPKTVEVKTDSPTVVVFTNKKLTSLQIKKIDEVSGKALPGAVFEVERQNGEKVTTHENGTEFTTDAQGFINIPTLEPDHYIVREIKEPEGYILDKTPKTVEVKTDSPTVVVFTNKYKSGLQIIKVDAKTNEPLAGAKFTVYKKSGDVIGEFTTDANGVIILDQLENGWYKLAETKAPDGYVISEEPKDIEIKGNNFHKIVFKNEKMSSLIIKKVDSIDKKVLEGAVFEVAKVNGEKIGEFTTDKSGLANVPNLKPDFYIVKEIKEPEGYALNSAPQTIEMKTDKPLEIVFENTPLAGLQIKKINSETRQPIEGVEFIITKMSGEKVGTYKTDKQGMIFVNNLDVGTYIVTETKPAEGYLDSKEPKFVEIKSKGKPILLEIENKPVSSLLIVKTDMMTGKPLAGVIFDVKRADGQRIQGSILDENMPQTANNSPNKSTTLNGDISGSYTTDANGRILINYLAPGEYHVIETKQLPGYELDTEVHTVTIVAGKQGVVKVQNKALSGLKILKVDSITKAPIYNVEFMVFDSNGKVVGTFYTDNMGVIDFAAILTEGRYTIRETRAATGYFRDDLPRTVEFIAGKYTEIVWENIPEAGQIQITKLSANDNEINGLEAGTPLEGAIFEVFAHKSGNLVDRFITASDGKGVSKPLPKGRYTIKEVQAPPYYKLSKKELDVEIEFATQILKLEFTNESANTGVSIDKVGPLEVMPGNNTRYDIKTVRNNSSVPLTDFYWRDVLPVDAVRLDKIVTGTYNQSLKYKIMVTTNKGNNLVIADNLMTTKNNVISATNADLGLGNDEFVTSFTLYFGNVKAGFSHVEEPKVYVNVLNKNLPNGYKFANKVDIGGKYQGEWVIGNSTWVTTIYVKTPNKLPKTGN